MKVGIIGCGLIGQKRAQHLGEATLVAAVDVIPEKAEALASRFPECTAFKDWQAIIHRQDIDVFIIATIHAELATIALEAINAGKHVLIEKPGGRNAAELKPLLTKSIEKKVVARIGFNHRYHRTFRKAEELVQQNALGDLMFIRARYGHGGRVNYHKEWRAQPELSGGGELIDQGIHLIDLARWFLGDFTEVQGQAETYFWNMPVDDNSFLLLKNPRKQIAFLHASCTEWKNLFSFEIYGKKGKIDIQGLGGSYGVPRITFYKMSEAMGPPETFIWEYPMPEDSFEVEFDEFLKDIRLSRQPNPGIHDAIQALNIVEEIYRMSNI